ncbi:proton-conducting transporter membrane subunit [Rhodoplanes sp. TEM]|uniref:Proton-conducting transporter membrane subunit n=2 Tax=Rhodoplanes TaxID=29407 RepID=A0ABT5J751_RHOTP|nr:proton-conducting transporter membrane subunit [Rhodoplanes tepidamans]MDC7785211.1 proton-conducting transporter membrane subunit [Rhodoplanes tepidamans]MDC7986748.1 proton-conducting transporter membrane subunit [Rhodoplanes sp. TEM]
MFRRIGAMLSQTTIDPLAVAWIGAIFLFFGEVGALVSLPRLTRTILVSTVAEIGYVLIGLGLGGPAGEAGAWMHIGNQIVMRGLVVVVGWYLIRRTRSSCLDDLRGTGHRMPAMATVFAFGIFSVMGLSPFKGSFSKFLILYAAIEQGHWMLAAVGTLATMVAATYYMLVVQRVCLERPVRQVTLAAAPRIAVPLAALLTVATVAISLWPEPVLHAAEALAHIGDGAAVPVFESPWSVLVLVPYVGGFVVWGLGRLSTRARDAAAVVIAAATVVLVAVDADLDPASRLFALLFAGIAFLMVVYSVDYMARSEWSNRYYFFALLMTGSLIGVATSHEFGNFYLFWELMTWTSYFLVVHEQTPKALRAGLVYFLMCASGAYVMHFGILLVHAQIGSFAFADLVARAGSLAPAAGQAAAACFFVAFAVKTGLVPLHAWLPLAHPQAPSSVSGPLSGILTKAGLFGMLKVLWLVFGATAISRVSPVGFDVVLMVLGAATLAYGEIRALLEGELKRMLAWSTLAQIGEIAAVLGIGTTLAADAALLHVTNHAVMKTLLFYAAGAFLLRTGLRRIEDLAGLGRRMPFTAGAYALASFAIIGLPPFSGFTSKFLMVYAAASAGRIEIAALMLLGGVVGLVYYLRVVRVLFFEPYTGDAAVREAPASMLVAIGVLAVAIVLGGLVPGVQLALVAEVGAELAARNGLAPAVLPDLVIAWPAGAVIAMVGAGAVWLVGRRSVAWAGGLAVAVLVAAAVGVAAEPGRYDLLSFCFALLIAGVGALNMLHATAYMAHGHAQPRFYAAVLVMIAGLIGMTAATDVYGFFAFWELMSSWALWAAIIHEEAPAARREGFKYVLFNTVGASFMFLGFALLTARTGSFDLAGIGAALPGLPVAAFGPAVVLILLGMVMKAAQLPLRIDWQMHPALAPTPVSGYISAVLLKSGPWGVLKLTVLFGGAAMLGRIGGTVHGQPVIMQAIAVIAGLTIVYAGAMAMVQNGIKLLLIYSTVCQLGYVLLGVALGTPLGVAGGLMHFVNHMLLKDTLFLVAGAVMVASHATMLDELGGLGRRMPFTFGMFLVAGLSLAGIPPLAGFSSKWVIFQACFQSGHWLLGSAAMVSSLFTLAAVLKFAHAAFMGAPTAKALEAREAPLAMLIPIAVLTGASLVVGVVPGLLLVPIAAIQAELGMVPIAASLVGPLPGAEAWSPGLVSVLVLILAAVLLPWLRLGHRAGVVRTHVHECGVGDLLPEATRVGAASLFETPDAAVRALFAPRRTRGGDRA